MDERRVLGFIDAWLATCAEYNQAREQYSAAVRSGFSTGNLRATRDGLDDEVRTGLAWIRTIARGVGQARLGDLMSDAADISGNHWATARAAVIEFRAWVSQREELAEILGPVGPQLNATALHPVIWGAAAALWDDGHFRQAVQSAGAALEGHLQGVAAVFHIGQELANLLSLNDPTPSSPRLRFDGVDPESPTWRSAHEGTAALIRGAMMGVRNLVSHPGWPDPDEQEALEMLAVLSYVARLTDSTVLYTANG